MQKIRMITLIHQSIQWFPILNAKMESVDLHAKARRIAIYYSQIAAYQAKQDYGFDMGDELAAKAVGQFLMKLILKSATDLSRQLLVIATLFGQKHFL